MTNNNSNKEIADLLFPDTGTSLEAYIVRYPKRELPEGAKVTRFGPSPTGFLHIGGLLASIVSERLARQSNGVFFLRIEDTDKKREIEGGVNGIIDALTRFGVEIKEGVKDEKTDIGAYGPYRQSKRQDIYATFVKHLIEEGSAYPCFCSVEELDATRKIQETQKIRPGYYGKWATHRDVTLDGVKRNLSQGKTFAVRLRSMGDWSNKIPFVDLIKGHISVTENDQDVILLKSDHLPTYHFAHVVDDYLMGTTHVIRGDEWLSSLPIHLQLFKLFNWQVPYYGHISPILKSDAGNKRKLSKRKDPEAAVDYYLKDGYPSNAVMEYLLNIANSDFEYWRRQNPTLPNTKFNIRLENFNKSGALFDINKFTNISKDVIAKMSAEEVYESTLRWALENDTSFAQRLRDRKDYFLKIFAIERNIENPRKDFNKWSDIKENTFYFFKDSHEEYVSKRSVEYPVSLDKSDVKDLINAYVGIFKIHSLKSEWFLSLQHFAEQRGFAKDIKTYKQNPSYFKGNIGDVAMILRVALTSKSKTPDLYEIMRTMGESMVKERLLFSANNI